uniref:Uncharacterized protein n=1 Tax=Oryza punctata TaxID=4537 RepID=A0A0E0M410_ORYPU
MEKTKHRHARSRSFSGGAIVSFLKSTAASFSASGSAAVPAHGRWSFNHRNAFSGPIVSIVPPEARGGGSRREHRSGYRTPEPSSPKVSCIGQIKKANAKKVKACCKNGACPLPPRPPADSATAARRQKSSLVRRMLFRRSRSRSSSSSRDGGFFKGRTAGRAGAAVAAAPAPAGLGQMKRFTSGRGAFEDFDWREAERRRDSDDDDDDDVIIAHSAPLVLGGGMVASEPRKEVNLWSRRPMAPPTPLQLP